MTELQTLKNADINLFNPETKPLTREKILDGEILQSIEISKSHSDHKSTFTHI